MFDDKGIGLRTLSLKLNVDLKFNVTLKFNV